MPKKPERKTKLGSHPSMKSVKTKTIKNVVARGRVRYEFERTYAVSASGKRQLILATKKNLSTGETKIILARKVPEPRHLPKPPKPTSGEKPRNETTIKGEKKGEIK